MPCVCCPMTWMLEEIAFVSIGIPPALIHTCVHDLQTLSVRFK